MEIINLGNLLGGIGISSLSDPICITFGESSSLFSLHHIVSA